MSNIINDIVMKTINIETKDMELFNTSIVRSYNSSAIFFQLPLSQMIILLMIKYW